MYLKALEIQGFKSFADKTELDIDRGITGVVGPNTFSTSNFEHKARWDIPSDFVSPKNVKPPSIYSTSVAFLRFYLIFSAVTT